MISTMKKELKKWKELYDEFYKLDELTGEVLRKLKSEDRDTTEEEELLFQKKRSLWDEMIETEKSILGEYFISFDYGEREMEILEECSEEEWTNAINVFKEAVLKVDELTNSRLCFLFFEAALSKACTDLWG